MRLGVQIWRQCCSAGSSALEDCEEHMGDRVRTKTDVHPGGVSRRIVLQAAGGAVLLTGMAARRGPAAAAQQASPAASPGADDTLLGQRVVVRLRTVKEGQDIDALLAQIQEGFVPLVSDLPGLDFYFVAANPETRALFSVGVFADEAGVEESNRIAGEWVSANMMDAYEGDPAIHNGVIGVATQAPTGDLLGKHVILRLREPAPDSDVTEVMRLIGDEYVPLAEEIPGFVAYFGSEDAETEGQAYVGIFDDAAGGEASTTVAREWLTENNYVFFEGDPTVAEGVIGAAAEAGA